MLVTLIPFFDEEMSVRAYSLFAQKTNYLLDPSMQGTRQYDGATQIPGLEIIENMGLDTLSADKEVFVEVNNISVFSDISGQCQAPHDRIVLLIDSTVVPEKMYIDRLCELKEMGYKLAMRKLAVRNFEVYRGILTLCDYILLDHKNIDISKAKIYFTNIYPRIRLCAGNIETQEAFEKLKTDGGYQFYEGKFYRVPVNKGDTEVSPLKVNYIELLNMVNASDFELSKAADVIGQDTALVISLLKIVNRMSRNSEITSIRHAAAMLGQRELKKWINTAVANQLYADKPNEITRLSLLRAKFAENVAPLFEMNMQASELFLMGLFSVLDLILNKSMEEALQMVKVSKEISLALIDGKGDFATVLDFILQYESANWQEVSRVMLVKNIEMDKVYDAYVQSLKWYRDLFV
ncbi:HDOD domain-containing protein [Parablautia intestinalis]|uniref:HDOD domain-containing protein n=1 Tax=Parablautia intestinalis TaxID=2320100 RepID=A0A3A9AN65_9FIRM|nr:HDOD domain-containing protein [Parablautia intestinalis]MCI8616351.1 HDOD domain-containing protein [Lachnospiraceae bacterium]RKI92837.1 HDOD domain-containing protein [Parablautia intestinalis]